MDGLLRSRLGSYLALVAASATLPAAAVHVLLGQGRAPVDAMDHLLVMAIASGVGAIACAVLLRAGIRERDGRAVVAGGAFGAMTLLLCAHGLATPGVLIGPNGLISLAGGLALPVGGALMALSAVPALRAPERVPLLGAALAVVLLVLLIACTAALVEPSLLPLLPGTGTPTAATFVVVGLLLYAFVAHRAVRTFVLTRRGPDLLVAVGVVWLGAALYPAMMLDAGTWAWWTGHVLELAGVALVGLPVAFDLRRRVPSRPLSGDLAAPALVAEEEAFLGARIHALMLRLADKDCSTEQHTRRVAELAVAIGEELGLAPGRLRELALGGLLHDIGKLTVPDEILGKPGRLTDDEMEIIRRHPGDGERLLRELGLARPVREMVRHHHERLDGSGYPDGLTGDRLRLEVRILAVADVFDALVSMRVYRAAWSTGRALELLGDAGQFDPECVGALERLLGHAQPLAA